MANRTETPQILPELSTVDLLTDLQTRAAALLCELRAFQTQLKLHKKQHEVEFRTFKRGIESEVRTLDKLGHVFGSPDVTINYEDGDDQESPQFHALRSSNLPFYEAVWETAKTSRCITALGKKMYFTTKMGTSGSKHCDTRAPSETAKHHIGRKRGVMVDIVAENGLQWIKVSTLTEKRLLFEMAKEGWETYGDFSDEITSDSEGDDFQKADDSTGKLELVQLAEDLRDAARVVRVDFRHPQIRFVLPKIREGILDDMDAFVADLRATGAVVQCSTETEGTLGPSQLDLNRLMPAALSVPLTPTINVDCTILLALISDISHIPRQQLSQVPADKSQHYRRTILKQIQAEEAASMLTSEIYPILEGRELHCTSKAAQRMREIVDIMATPSERHRADVLLGEGQYKGQPLLVLRHAFSTDSLHPAPEGLLLPVKVIDFNVQEMLSSTTTPAILARYPEAFPTSVAARAKETLRLTPINSSVFLYGWLHQITTISSNRTVASGLVKTINDIMDADERDGGADFAHFVGPLIYVCENARSLIGKARGNGDVVPRG